MKKLFLALCLLVPLICISQEQHYIFSTTRGSSNFVELLPGTEILGNETEVSPQNLLNKELLITDDGGIKFTVSNYVNTDAFKVGLKTATGTEFSFNFSNGQVTSSYGNWNSTTANNTFQIVKVANTISFYNNCSFITQVTCNDALQVFFSSTYSSSTQVKTDIDLTSKKGAFSPCSPALTNGSENQVYVALKKQLDGNCISLPNDIIRIKFDEDYNASLDNATYDIYNWKREKKQSGTLSLVNKTNWISVIGISQLVTAEPYILEVTTNKGEKYFLRFKLGNTRS